LAEVHHDLRVDLAVLLDQLRNVDMVTSLPTKLPHVPAGTLFSSIQATMSSLHVAVDEDMIPVLLLLDSLVEEQPDSVLSASTDPITKFVSLLQVIEDGRRLTDTEGFQPVTEDTNMSIVSALCGDDSSKVGNLGYLDTTIGRSYGSMGRSRVVT